MNAKTTLKRERISRRPRPAFRPPSDEDNCPVAWDDMGVWVLHHCGAYPSKQWLTTSRWKAS